MTTIHVTHNSDTAIIKVIAAALPSITPEEYNNLRRHIDETFGLTHKKTSLSVVLSKRPLLLVSHVQLEVVLHMQNVQKRIATLSLTVNSPKESKNETPPALAIWWDWDTIKIPDQYTAATMLTTLKKIGAPRNATVAVYVFYDSTNPSQIRAIELEECTGVHLIDRSSWESSYDTAIAGIIINTLMKRLVPQHNIILTDDFAFDQYVAQMCPRGVTDNTLPPWYYHLHGDSPSKLLFGKKWKWQRSLASVFKHIPADRTPPPGVATSPLPPPESSPRGAPPALMPSSYRGKGLRLLIPRDSKSPPPASELSPEAPEWFPSFDGSSTLSSPKEEDEEEMDTIITDIGQISASPREVQGWIPDHLALRQSK